MNIIKCEKMNSKLVRNRELELENLQKSLARLGLLMESSTVVLTSTFYYDSVKRKMPRVGIEPTSPRIAFTPPR